MSGIRENRGFAWGKENISLLAKPRVARGSEQRKCLMLYKLDVSEPEKSTKVSLKTPSSLGVHEKHIEGFLRSRLSEVVSEDYLMLIGQERRWQEEADLLALDKKGDLFIFELKRWQSNSENILQVMRYGQIFGRYKYNKLQDLARRQQKLEGSLQEKHKEYFELPNALDESEFNQDQQFVLVTNGIDADSISAVDYWSRKGLRITCSPYRTNEIGHQPYIQFDTYNPNDDVILEVNTQFFIVNTNRTYMGPAWKTMLGNMTTGRASAYYDRKFSICNIPRNSIIYLYHTHVGVVAKGKSTDSFGREDYEGDKDAEYYVPLDFHWAVNEEDWATDAVGPWEINSRLKTGHRFRQTVFGIPEQMANAIDDIAKEKQQGTSDIRE